MNVTFTERSDIKEHFFCNGCSNQLHYYINLRLSALFEDIFQDLICLMAN